MFKTLQPYHFYRIPGTIREKFEGMIADISPLGLLNEGTVDEVEAWGKDDIILLMAAAYNEARHPKHANVDKSELVSLIRAVDPDCIFSDDDGQNVTTEWLVGTFAGRGFVAPTLDEAIEELCLYLDENIGHESIVGRVVTASGWPDLKKVKQYLKYEP